MTLAAGKSRRPVSVQCVRPVRRLGRDDGDQFRRPHDHCAKGAAVEGPLDVFRGQRQFAQFLLGDVRGNLQSVPDLALDLDDSGDRVLHEQSVIVGGPAGIGDRSVANAGWPTHDDALLVEDTVTAVVQVQGKVRDRLEVSPDISEEELRELALASEHVQRALDGRALRTVIVRAPKLVTIVPA